MTSRLRARAAIVADGSPRGTQLTTIRSDPPIALRPTAGAVYLAASAAGPVGGDEVAFDLTVGAGASLEVRSVSATLALPGPTPACSTMSIVASVGRGAELRWLVEPTVLVRGCDHRNDTRIALAAGAALVWREAAVLGRSGETGGSMRQRLRIDRDGRPLLRSEVAAGPAWPASTGPAGTGGYRAIGTLTVVGPAAARVVDLPGGGTGPARVAVAALARDAVVVMVLAPTARALREALERALPSGWNGSSPVAR